MTAQLDLVDTDPVMDPSTPKMSAADVRRRIEGRYRPAWLVLHEVSSQLGEAPSAHAVANNLRDGASKRYLDSLAIGLYGRTGHALIGFEIKVSRADWLAELRKPAKAAVFWPKLSSFYVAAPKGVVKLDELPAGWGLLLCHQKATRIAHAAAVKKPKIDRAWVAAIVARAANPVQGPPQLATRTDEFTT